MGKIKFDDGSVVKLPNIEEWEKLVGESKQIVANFAWELSGKEEKKCELYCSQGLIPARAEEKNFCTALEKKTNARYEALAQLYYRPEIKRVDGQSHLDEVEVWQLTPLRNGSNKSPIVFSKLMPFVGVWSTAELHYVTAGMNFLNTLWGAKIYRELKLTPYFRRQLPKGELSSPMQPVESMGDPQRLDIHAQLKAYRAENV